MKEEFDIVWDLETTGFVAPKAKILEVGCFIIKGDKIEKMHLVFQNHLTIPEKIVEITGITNEIVDKEGENPRDQLLKFLPLFKTCRYNITHNGVKFDIPFLVNYAADILFWNDFEKKKVTEMIRSTARDTAVIVKAQKLGIPRTDKESFLQFADKVMSIRAYGIHFNLGLCVDEMKIERPEGMIQHRAMADVYYTNEVYKNIIQKQNEQKENESQKDEKDGKKDENTGGEKAQDPTVLVKNVDGKEIQYKQKSV